MDKFNFDQSKITAQSTKIKKEMEKIVSTYCLSCLQGDVPFADGLGALLVAISGMYAALLTSAGKTLKMDEEEFSVFLDKIVMDLKKVINEKYRDFKREDKEDKDGR